MPPGYSTMVSGSVAAMIYGEPRLTNDIEGMLQVSGQDLDMDVINAWVARLEVQSQWTAIAGDTGFP